MAAVPARLMIIGPDGEETVVLHKQRFTIGRHSGNDLKLTSGAVSREHAAIVLEDDVYVLRDTASKFGTFVNGQRTTMATLRHGDHIELGPGSTITLIFLDGPSQQHDAHDSGITAGSGVRHVAVLLQSLRALGSGRVVDDVLALVLDAAIDLTGAERGFIMLANPQNELEMKLARTRDKVTLPGRTVAIGRKIPETVFATGERLIVRDLADEDLHRQHDATVALGIRHIVCVPLHLVRFVERAADRRGHEAAIGVLYLDSHEPGAMHTASTLTALEALSEEATLAIENARLFRDAQEKARVEHELEIAWAIQQALMPKPSRDGRFFQAYGTSVPCRAIGGDFFDYIDVPGNAFGFIVGDVAGKGAPAALLETATLGMFGAEADERTSAAEVIARVNRGILRRAIEATYLTAFYGILAADGRFVFCNAGHNPPLHVSRSGISQLTTGGTVVGLFADAHYEEGSVVLEPGDTVVVFSDGVTEARNPRHVEFGDDRLIATVSKHHGEPPQVLVAAVLAELRAFCGDAVQYDDVTLLAVTYTNR
jgi:serine phosphatase RsbU (regulator of sigma subunit)/pSer/pThr/pTyr-binding forkhead associated (FHA) protein